MGTMKSTKNRFEKLSFFDKQKLKNLIARSNSNGMSRFYMAFDKKSEENSHALKHSKR